MAWYRYKGRGVVEANGYRWEGRSTTNPNEPTAPVEVTDEATLRKLKTHPSFAEVAAPSGD